MNKKTFGIVLKRTNINEADRILTIFTREMGKVKAIAKGARKIKSRLAGSIEPFLLTNFMLYPGKTFWLVTGAEVVKNFENVQTDVKKTANAFYVGEIIDKTLEEDEPHKEIFELFTNYLEYLNTNDDSFMPVYTAKILERLGFKPEVYECLHCREKLKPEQNYWDNIEGGVICQNCNSKLGHGKALDNNVIKILRLIFDDKFSVSANLNIDKKYQKETFNVLEDYIEHIIERELKSKGFLRVMK